MKYFIEVRGKEHEWLVCIDEAQADAMRTDGFEVMEQHNSIPVWVPEWLWLPLVALQDMWDTPSRWWRGRRK